MRGQKKGMMNMSIKNDYNKLIETTMKFLEEDESDKIDFCILPDVDNPEVKFDNTSIDASALLKPIEGSDVDDFLNFAKDLKNVIEK